ncbi:MAG: cytochrome b/b6 domain-containing protein [Armatimonadetes bacterium]|nr:cytochrome b/b6 domain-containing protein [Armatimonadota bacterium]MDE2207190.1 cytochrome b/b6 domain-containing protein [Armatimonadota bacterium]
MKRIEKKHPLAIRWFHWINFPVLMVMIWSGLLIYWANDVMHIRVAGKTLFHFFPNWFYSRFNLDQRLAEGMAWHFTFMWLFVINGLLYVLTTAFLGEWRFILPNRHSFREAIQVTLHDLHLSRKQPPRRKFNGAQQIAYTSIIIMGAGSTLTGLAIYKPIQLAWLTALFGGYTVARFFHFWLTIGFCLFFVVHIGQVVKTGWGNFRAMVTGFELVEAPEPEGDAAVTPASG